MIREYPSDALQRTEIRVVVLSINEDNITFPSPIKESPVKNGSEAEDFYWDLHPSIEHAIWPAGIDFEDWTTKRKVPKTRYFSLVEDERPPFDGTENGEFLDIKRYQINSRDAFPNVGDLVDIYGESFQKYMCKFFYVIFCKEYQHTEKTHYGSSSTRHTVCRICYCQNTNYTI